MLRMVKKIGYSVKRQKGSHRVMSCEGRPDLLFAFHDSAEIPPRLVRKILVSDIGFSEAEALRLL
ncbi:type II toxin-antitoxin system HicA family toxin [Homoserinibacter sp. YIM 151385]|uniref:type II toxin-antitoxin system HicA family toxin n=1 Tax=Homoserinibacter sp. YIM 151385 TaxID=2985506 RepID=UPI003FA574CB